MKKRRSAQIRRMRRAILNRVILAAVTLLVILGGFRVQVLASEPAQPRYEKVYHSIEVKRGDTLWSIAEDYCGTTDCEVVRNYVKDLKTINSIDNDRSLRAGAYVVVYSLEKL